MRHLILELMLFDVADLCQIDEGDLVRCKHGVGELPSVLPQLDVQLVLEQIEVRSGAKMAATPPSSGERQTISHESKQSSQWTRSGVLKWVPKQQPAERRRCVVRIGVPPPQEGPREKEKIACGGLNR